jgi:hypothetical protein
VTDNPREQAEAFLVLGGRWGELVRRKKILFAFL